MESDLKKKTNLDNLDLIRFLETGYAEVEAVAKQFERQGLRQGGRHDVNLTNILAEGKKGILELIDRLPAEGITSEDQREEFCKNVGSEIATVKVIYARMIRNTEMGAIGPNKIKEKIRDVLVKVAEAIDKMVSFPVSVKTEKELDFYEIFEKVEEAVRYVEILVEAFLYANGLGEHINNLRRRKILGSDGETVGEKELRVFANTYIMLQKIWAKEARPALKSLFQKGKKEKSLKFSGIKEILLKWLNSVLVICSEWNGYSFFAESNNDAEVIQNLDKQFLKRLISVVQELKEEAFEEKSLVDDLSMNCRLDKAFYHRALFLPNKFAEIENNKTKLELSEISEEEKEFFIRHWRRESEKRNGVKKVILKKIATEANKVLHGGLKYRTAEAVELFFDQIAEEEDNNKREEIEAEEVYCKEVFLRAVYQHLDLVVKIIMEGVERNVVYKSEGGDLFLSKEQFERLTMAFESYKGWFNLSGASLRKKNLKNLLTEMKEPFNENMGINVQTSFEILVKEGLLSQEDLEEIQGLVFPFDLLEMGLENIGVKIETGEDNFSKRLQERFVRRTNGEGKDIQEVYAFERDYLKTAVEPFISDKDDNIGEVLDRFEREGTVEVLCKGVNNTFHAGVSYRSIEDLSPIMIGLLIDVFFVSQRVAGIDGEKGMEVAGRVAYRLMEWENDLEKINAVIGKNGNIELKIVSLKELIQSKEEELKRLDIERQAIFEKIKISQVATLNYQNAEIKEGKIPDSAEVVRLWEVVTSLSAKKEQLDSMFEDLESVKAQYVEDLVKEEKIAEKLEEYLERRDRVLEARKKFEERVRALIAESYER